MCACVCKRAITHVEKTCDVHYPAIHSSRCRVNMTLPPEARSCHPVNPSPLVSRRVRTTGAVLLRLGEHWARVERLQALEACKGQHVIWGVGRERRRGAEGKGEGGRDMKERRPGARVQREKKREGTRVRGHGRNGLVRKQCILSARVNRTRLVAPQSACSHQLCERDS
jgi:hypothetical protein